ncbi:hypothetical protein C5167_006341 [Papaver somniferum]|uniref:Uncharacterized protein n=1 Tax=Papaver somniferum TaxID=3469 RepID=A0A4Y7JHB7_PAPSO|nr:hypothetical protein C5167_006341 [Papaver somniferum]
MTMEMFYGLPRQVRDQLVETQRNAETFFNMLIQKERLLVALYLRLIVSDKINLGIAGKMAILVHGGQACNISLELLLHKSYESTNHRGFGEAL